MPTLEDKYLKTGKVLLAFRHLPLESIHPFAQKAAEAAECAGRQDRFWEMHDQLFRDPRQLSESGIRAGARVLNLEPSKFSLCLDGQATDKVKADAASARRLGVTSTPAFLFGTVQTDRRIKVLQRISGARPVGEFQAILDSLLSDTK